MQKDVKGIRVLEALAATGLRAIRYAKELDGVGQIVANDMDSGAVASIRRNVEFNSAQATVTPHEADARMAMLSHQHVRLSLHRKAAPRARCSGQDHTRVTFQLVAPAVHMQRARD